MTKVEKIINKKKKYDAGFETLIESENIIPGINEEIIKIISKKKKNQNFYWTLD